MSRVLIVEDEVNIRKLYKSEFADAGYEVITATTNKEAMQCVQDHSPDLVVLDIKLGEDSGLDCLRQIKLANPSISVVLNSGFSTYKDDFSSWLADAYLMKSGDTADLLRCVADLLEAKLVGENV